MRKTSWEYDALKAMSIAIVIIAGIFIGVGVVDQAIAIDDGRVDTYYDGIRIGGDGTKIKSLQMLELVYANTSSAAETLVDATTLDTWSVALAWQSTAADPGKTTYAITADTLTVQTNVNTTGTLSVLAVGY